MAPPRRPNNNKKDIPRAAAAKAPAAGKEEEKCTEDPNCSCVDDNTLTCDICLEVMHNVMNLAPCNHKFCAACIHEWLDRQNTCPKCRYRYTNVTRDPLVNRIIENYLEKNPSRGRSEAQLVLQDELELKLLRKRQVEREAEESDDEEEDESMEVDGADDPLAHVPREYREQIRALAPRGGIWGVNLALRPVADDEPDDDDTISLQGFRLNRDREYRHAEEDARIERLQRQKEEREAKIRAERRPANRGVRIANRRATPVARRSNDAVQEPPRQYNLRARRNANV